MKTHAFAENYLQQLCNDTTVVYLEPNPTKGMEVFIRKNLEALVMRLDLVGVDFVYLPVLMQCEAFGEVLQYHHPALGDAWKELSLSELYRVLGRRFGVADSANGLLVVESTTAHLSGWFVPVSDEKDLLKEVEALEVRFQLEKEARIEESHCLYSPCFEADVFEQEVDELVKRLVESGSIRLIGKVMEQLQQATTKVSRLFITDDCRIFLKDFGMKEVVMQPLAKCLFLLYLRHEEGIRFKQLSEYEDELLSIYRGISLREKPDDVVESIRAMTDPLSNSVNEKCSRIRAAFLMVIAEELAGDYLITGRKGEVKRIRLDRSLVEYQ